MEQVSGAMSRSVVPARNLCRLFSKPDLREVANIAAIRHRLTTLVRDPDPSARSLRVPLLPADCAPIQSLRNRIPL